jgi:hypothetical protein
MFVSIHTLHELEASLRAIVSTQSGEAVSIHTLHELEARFNDGNLFAKTRRNPVWVFPFIRFTNWKQDFLFQKGILVNPQTVSIHTLHELEARLALQS